MTILEFNGGDWFLVLACIVSVALVIRMVHGYWTGALPWPTRQVVIGPYGLHWKNVLKHARREWLLFSGCLYRELGDRHEFVEAVRRTNARLEFLFGPDVDVGAKAMLRVIKEKPNAELFLITGEHRDDVLEFDPETDTWRWRQQHFFVGDSAHVTIEERHAVVGDPGKLTYEETLRDPGLADEYLDEYVSMRDQWAIRVDKQQLVSTIQRLGRFITFDEAGRPREAPLDSIHALAAHLGESLSSASRSWAC